MTSFHHDQIKIFNMVERRVLEQIKPKPEEYRLVFSIYRKIRDVIINVLNEFGVDAEVSLQGSIAKDTWLSGERDLDIFVLFPESWSKDRVKKEGFSIILEAAKRIGPYQIRYAEHPYVRLIINDVEADIVPALRISNPAMIKTAVDRTPFHTKYVIEHLTPEKRDQVRLLKKFLKGIGVYGAEVKVKGFSGYLAEILVIMFGGFREVLKEASKWKPPVFINTLNLPQKEARELFRKLKRKYPTSVLFVPDPIDPERNVAAAVSKKSLAIFSLASRCYLMNPSISFFFPREVEQEFEDLALNVKNYDRCMVFLIFPLLSKLPPDTLWGEIDRIRDRVIKVLKVFDIETVYSSAWTNEEDIAIIGLELNTCNLPLLKCFNGPPFYSVERAKKYISKHYRESIAGPWINDDGELLSLSKRKYTSIYEILIERKQDYLVAPDFRNINPIVTSIEGLEKLWHTQSELKKWLQEFVLRKYVWMENCIE